MGLGGGTRKAEEMTGKGAAAKVLDSVLDSTKWYRTFA